MAHKPKDKEVGDGIEVIKFEVLDEKGGLLHPERVRSVIVYFILFMLSASLAITGIYGLFSQDFELLNSVWSNVQLPVGAIIGFYFRSS